MKTYKITRLTVHAGLFMLISTWIALVYVSCKQEKNKETSKKSNPVYIDWGDMNYIFKIDDSTIGRYVVKEGNFVGLDTLRKAVILDTNDIYIPGVGYYTIHHVSNDSGFYFPDNFGNHTQSDEARPNLPYKIEGRKHIHGKIKAKIKKPNRLYIGDQGDDGGGGKLEWGGDTTFNWRDDFDTTWIVIDSTPTRRLLIKKPHSESIYMPREVSPSPIPSWAKPPSDTLRIGNIVITMDTFYYDYSDTIPEIDTTLGIKSGDISVFDGTWANPFVNTLGQDTVSKYYSDATGDYQIFYDVDRSSCLVPATNPPGQPHHDAYITVYALLKNGKKYMVGAPMKGTYVPNGCFEDVPENWVKAAWKSIK